MGQLLDDRQRVGDAARLDVRPDFIYLVFDDSRDHSIPPKVQLSKSIFFQIDYSTVGENVQ